MTAARLSIVLVIAGLLLSCDPFSSYQPSGRHKVDVAEPDTSVVHLGVAGDTVRTWGPTTLTYSVELKGNEFRKAVLEVGRKTFQGTQNEVTFDTEKLDNGRHSASLKILIDSGSGSLADQVGTEDFLYVWKGVIHIDNSRPDLLPWRGMAIQNGVWHLRWRRFPKDEFGFQAYQIHRCNQRDPEYLTCGPENWRKVDTVTSADSPSWGDVDYLGERVKYRVCVRARGQTTCNSPRTAKEYTPRLRSPTQLGTYRFRLRWTQSPFTTALDHYALERRVNSYDFPNYIEGDPGKWKVAHTSSDVSDTTAVDTTSVFGSVFEYRLAPKPLHLAVRSDTQSVDPGPRVDWQWVGNYFAALDRYGSFESSGGDHGVFRFYEPSTKARTSSYQLPMPGTIDDNYVFKDGARAYQFGERIVREYNLETKELADTDSLNDVLPSEFVVDNQDRPHLVSRETGRLFLKLKVRGDYFFQRKGLAIVDLDPVRVIALYDRWDEEKEERTGIADVEKIAPSGNYATMSLGGGTETNLYEVRSDTVVKIGKTPDASSYFFTGTDFPEGPDHLVEYEEGTITVRSLPDQSVVRTVEVARNLQRVHYSGPSGFFTGYREKKGETAEYRIYGNSGTIKHIVEVIDDRRYHIADRTLWGSSGHYRSISSF